MGQVLTLLHLRRPQTQTLGRHSIDDASNAEARCHIAIDYCNLRPNGPLCIKALNSFTKFPSESHCIHSRPLISIIMSTTDPRQTRLANIPEEAIKDAFESLGELISPEDDDKKIRKSLKQVWVIVYDALEEDPNLKGLANKKEFHANVERKQQFLKSLRDMAKDNSWERLFDDGTLFAVFGSNF